MRTEQGTGSALVCSVPPSVLTHTPWLQGCSGPGRLGVSRLRVLLGEVGSTQPFYPPGLGTGVSQEPGDTANPCMTEKTRPRETLTNLSKDYGRKSQILLPSCKAVAFLCSQVRMQISSLGQVDEGTGHLSY